jgi:hypothetical protein
MNVAIFLLLLVLSAATNAQGTRKADNWNTIDHMCGQLVYSQELPVKGEENTFQDKTRPAKKVELRLFKGAANEPCCEKLPLVDKTTTRRDGQFKFKSVAAGDYWVETRANGRVYRLAVHYSPEKSDSVQCKDLLFEVKDSGEFQLA